MSTAARNVPALGANSGWRSGKKKGLPWSANLYLLGTAAVTAAAVLPFLLDRNGWRGGWLTFVVLASCAAVAQLFTVRTGRDQGFHTAVAFLVAAALLLPPGLVALVALVQHVPEWIHARYRWYIQSFNICNFALSALGAYGVAHGVLAAGPAGSGLAWALASLGAIVSFVLLNHVLLALMLYFARGHSFRESGLFGAGTLCRDLVVGALGVALAYVWEANPWLVPVVVAPLVLSHSSFSVLALLRASEERFRAMFESSSMGIGLADLEGRLLSTNRALEELLGHRADELRGRSLLELVHSDDVTLTTDLSKRLVSGDQDHYQVEQRYVRRDGTIWWGNLTVSLIRDANGEPELTIAMLKDVTERKRAERARQRLLIREQEQSERLRELDRLKDEFIATVSHELRTPLTSIIGYLELLLEGEAGALEPEQRQFLEVVERNAGNLHDLVRDLLFVGQVNTGKLELDLEPVDLSTLAAECVESARPEAEAKRITLRFDAGDLPALSGDQRRIGQVMQNLISNALKFTEDGGEVGVRTSADHDGRVVLEVQDSGIGVAEADLPRLFDRFFRAPAASERAIPGTGLGLAIVKTIVDAHGGRITVSSGEGVGTRFRVELPVLEASELGLAVAAAA